MRRFERYVAIGDSTVEGLDDPDGSRGYRGWADRLAERLAADQGSILYANLAVRGRTTRQVRDGQLAPALAMNPDLAVVVSGTNDLLRPRFDATTLEADFEMMQRALIGSGATVLTFTLPDLSPVMPIARLMRGRLHRMNDALRAASSRTGTLLCDFARHPVGSDPRLWSDDRLHANAAGHARMADALADLLGLAGTTSDWREPLPSRPPASAGSLIRAEMAWMRNHLVPWIVRHIRGRSSGDGVEPKRPELLEIKSTNSKAT